MKYRLLTFALTAVMALTAASANDDDVVYLMDGRCYFSNISAIEYNGHNRNYDIVCGNDAMVYVANFEGLLIWNGASWTMYHTPGITRVTDLYKASDGKVWFCGYNVLGYIESEDDIHYIISDESATDYGEIAGLDERDNSIVFNAADGHSYCVIDNEVVRAATDYPELSSESSEKQKSTYLYNGALKVMALQSKGLVFESSKGIRYYMLSTKDGLCSDNINALSSDDNTTIWGATDNGLFRTQVALLTHYSETDGISGQVTSILIKENDVYVATLQGLFKRNDQDRFDRVPGISLACWQLTQGSDGEILAATAEGVFSISDQIRQLTTSHTLSIAQASDGLVCGTTDGIWLSKPDGSHIKLSDAQNVVKMEKDSAGGIWAINLYQKTYYRQERSDVFMEKDGCPYSLLLDYTDKFGRHWCSKDDGKGLKADSLPSLCNGALAVLDQFSIQALAVDSGSIMAGGNFGVIWVDLSYAETFPQQPAKVYIRNFTSDESGVSCQIATDQTDIFGTMKFSTRLKSDGGWSQWVSDRNISLSHLGSGKYNLTVRCLDAYGNISESEPMEFSIPTPWYFRWYTLLLLAILVLVSIRLFLKWRLARTEAEKARLEAVVEERTRDLKEAQGQLLRQEREATVGKLTKGLIDRILNPMNYINNFSHLTKELVKDLGEDIEDEKDKMDPDTVDDCTDVLKMMETNLGKIEDHGLATTRILKAMEEMLKERNVRTNLQEINSICAKDIEMLNTYYKTDIAELSIKVDAIIPQTPVMVNADAENLSKVIMSMIGNSIYSIKKKCSKADAYAALECPEIRLTLAAAAHGNGCTVSIWDNGIGIEETIADKVFDPFFTTKPTAEAPGVGLYLSQQIIQDCGGTIELRSEKDKFAEFTITLH